MAFSGALTLTDLNDYLGPSQACIKPVEAPHSASGAPDSTISMEDGVYVEAPVGAPRARTQLETAQISLNDCLACSGCVTSAETVLIGVQSLEEVRKELQRKDDRIFVASISSQTMASLQARMALPMHAVWDRVTRSLRSIGFDVVQDMALARHMSLVETVREFRTRYQARWHGTKDAPKLPMLASACPGWVCYAEKAHAELLPYVATTKSPQQLAGLLAKRVWGPQCRGRDMSDENVQYVYHVAVMPCYDKKLEAARQEPGQASKEVDCVLTTGELYDLTIDVDVSAKAEQTSLTWPPEPGSSSGGYLFAVLLDAYMSWTQAHPDTQPLVELRTIRSSDYTEYTLRAPDGTVIFKGATCYGFRNIQNLVRKVQRETGAKSSRGRGRMRSMVTADQQHPYDYVEVMACPGGCVNGGGQLRPPEDWAHAIETEAQNSTVQGWQGTDRRWVQHVEDAYWNDENRKVSVESASALLEDAARGSLRSWLSTWDERASDMVRRFPYGDLHTTFHAVASSTDGLSVQW